MLLAPRPATSFFKCCPWQANFSTRNTVEELKSNKKKVKTKTLRKLTQGKKPIVRFEVIKAFKTFKTVVSHIRVARLGRFKTYTGANQSQNVRINTNTKKKVTPRFSFEASQPPTVNRDLHDTLFVPEMLHKLLSLNSPGNM